MQKAKAIIIKKIRSSYKNPFNLFLFSILFCSYTAWIEQLPIDSLLKASIKLCLLGFYISIRNAKRYSWFKSLVQRAQNQTNRVWQGVTCVASSFYWFLSVFGLSRVMFQEGYMKTALTMTIDGRVTRRYTKNSKTKHMHSTAEKCHSSHHLLSSPTP